ncbi:MAG: hypothetical protein A2Y80_07145 [Deltaproteobacteria bacterium RBG_13_58_19]|nr:MAG: hypothetical protein A2Y80_07145 [Deltaproteobacteria bacterium RBG_13_58_19]
MTGPQPLPKRVFIYGASAATAVLLVLGILILVGVLAQRYSWRWDVTRDRSQSLSAISQALLQEVHKPLIMTAFYPEGPSERQKAKEILQIYAVANRNVTFQFVDPDRQPLKAKEAGYRYPGNILLEYEGRRQMADRPDEESITGTLRKLLKPEHKKIFFLVGHGERSIGDNQREGLGQASRSLANEGYEVADLNLFRQAQIPQDAAAVIIAAPQKPLFPQEVSALKDYLGRGGRLFVMLEPYHDGGLKEFLAGYGVELDEGMILDQNQVGKALGASADMALVVQYGPHRITQDFTNVITIFPMARPLFLKQEGKGVTLAPLASTTPTSWEKLGKAWQKEGKADFNPKLDRKGPFTLAALVEVNLKPQGKNDPKHQPATEKKPPEENKTYLAVFGDVDFAANGYFNLSMNGDLFLNTVNFLAAEEKQIIIRRDERKPQPLTLTGRQIITLALFSIIVLPLVMLTGGIWAYRRRRRLR